MHRHRFYIYENVEAAKKNTVGSSHTDLYKNVLANGEQLTGTSNPAGRIYENVTQMMSPDGLHYSHASRCARRGPPQRHLCLKSTDEIRTCEREQCHHA